MKKYIISIFLFVTILQAEPDISLGGYIYELPILNIPSSFSPNTSAQSSFFNLTRFRFRPEAFLGENTRITFNYELDLAYSSIAFPAPPNADKTNRQAIDLKWNLFEEKNFVASHFIDMLYFKHIMEFGEITFGRQVISWGTGRIWQPTDMFNPINPANFSKIEKNGADALSAKLYLANFTDLELVYNFLDKISKGNYAARFRTNFAEYDVSIVTGYFDEKIILGGDFAGNFFNAGIRGEGLWSIDKTNPENNYLRVLAGLDYQFSKEIYCLIEYQHNGAGTRDVNRYNEYLFKLIKGEIQNIGINYLALMCNYQPAALLNISLSTLNNLDDGSGFIGLTALFNALENLNVGLGGMILYGSRNSEYSLYSNSVYLTCQYFY